MSLTKLSLGGNNDVIHKLFLPRESLVSDIPAGDRNIANLFYSVAHDQYLCALRKRFGFKSSNHVALKRVKTMGQISHDIFVLLIIHTPHDNVLA